MPAPSVGRPTQVRLVVRVGAAAALVVGVLVATVTWRWAGQAQSASWTGGTVAGQALQLLVGLALLASGARLLLTSSQRGGGLLCVAGLSWFVADWNTQFTRTSLAFTLALTLSAVTPVLIAHAVLRYSGSILEWFARLALIIAYLSSVGLAVAAALVSDPRASGCAECAPNLIALHTDSVFADRILRVSVSMGPAWSALLVVAIALQIRRGAAVSRMRTLPVQAPGIAYVLSVLAMYVVAARHSYLRVDNVTRTVWAVGGMLLITLAIGTHSPVITRRRARRRVARLVVELASAPAAGDLSAELARMLRDPDVRLLYPTLDGTLVDAEGRPALIEPVLTRTPVVSASRTVAVLEGRRSRIDGAELTEIGESAGIVLENEQIEPSRRRKPPRCRSPGGASSRPATRNDARLERDLHDGAQQALVTLSVAVQLASMRTTKPAEVEDLSRARQEVVEALAELRTLGRGIYPSELYDDGLRAALQSLAEASASPLRLSAVPDGRFPVEIEAAAYQVVAQLARLGAVDVRATSDREALHLDVTTESLPMDPLVLVGLRDRVGAVGGHLVLEGPDARPASVQAVLPCGS